MKTVFSNSELAHVWSNNLQDNGRSSNGSYYFTNGKLYSYGSHFLIANHFTNENGTVVLFTTRSYSSSTSKHISYARQAINGQKLIYCYNPNGTDHKTNFDSWYSIMDGYAKQLLTARKPEKYLNEIAEQFNQCKIYAEYFGLTIPADILTLSKLETKSEYAAINEKRETAAEEAEAKRIAKLQKEHKQDLAKWRKFELSRLNIHNGFDYLRFNDLKNRIETSQAVEIPAAIAKEFYTYIIDTVAKGGCMDCNKQLLNYTVKQINKEFIVVGCHKITIAEIKKAIKLIA